MPMHIARPNESEERNKINTASAFFDVHWHIAFPATEI